MNKFFNGFVNKLLNVFGWVHTFVASAALSPAGVFTKVAEKDETGAGKIGTIFGLGTYALMIVGKIFGMAAIYAFAAAFIKTCWIVFAISTVACLIGIFVVFAIHQNKRA